MGDQWMNDCLTVYIEKDVTRRINMKKSFNNFNI